MCIVRLSNTMENILDAVKAFSNQSYNAKRNAQINLEGRTHWADDSTLAFFGCKISRAFDDSSGKLFAICYSQKAGFDEALGREHGFIVFDLWGNCVVDGKYPNGKKRDRELADALKKCVSYADLITQTGRDSRISQLQREIECLEGAE